MKDEAQDRARRGYTVIDKADLVDVTSYDSFPASDPPSWIATGIGSPHPDESLDRITADKQQRFPSRLRSTDERAALQDI